MNHTPAPWNAANTGNHQGLVISEATGANVATAYDKADAALIAAAPDMLEALEWFAEFCDEHPEWTEEEFPHGSNEAEWLCAARAAIQKARGQ